MKIKKLDQKFGLEARNLLLQAKDQNINGALACLETFYYAFNNRDLEVFKQIWLDHELIQLNNPLGGMLRGIVPITDLYDRIFHGNTRVWVELSNIVLYQSGKMATFAGQEIGEFTANGQTLELRIRTTRFFGYSEEKGQWVQLHHHGSIDDVELLNKYQQAVK